MMPAPSPETPIEELPARLAPGARLAGLDLGTKTIGVALSDPGSDRNPLLTIHRTKFGKDAEALLKLCEAEKVGGLVLGLPINMNGTEGPRAQATRAFLRNLALLTELPVVLWDERLSTAGAERAMLEADLSRKKRAEKIDAAAAAFILQGALDRLARSGPRDERCAQCAAACSRRHRRRVGDRELAAGPARAMGRARHAHLLRSLPLPARRARSPGRISNAPLRHARSGARPRHSDDGRRSAWRSGRCLPRASASTVRASRRSSRARPDGTRRSLWRSPASSTARKAWR